MTLKKSADKSLPNEHGECAEPGAAANRWGPPRDLENVHRRKMDAAIDGAITLGIWDPTHHRAPFTTMGPGDGPVKA